MAEPSDGDISTAEENSDTEMEDQSDTEASDTDPEEDEVFWVPNTNTFCAYLYNKTSTYRACLQLNSP